MFVFTILHLYTITIYNPAIQSYLEQDRFHFESQSSFLVLPLTSLLGIYSVNLHPDFCNAVLCFVKMSTVKSTYFKHHAVNENYFESVLCVNSFPCDTWVHWQDGVIKPRSWNSRPWFCRAPHLALCCFCFTQLPCTVHIPPAPLWGNANTSRKPTLIDLSSALITGKTG